MKQKKIKLVISDLHLGLGQVLEGGKLNTLEEFYFDDKFVQFLSYYTTGMYENHHVELILNGDILNLLQVPYKGHYTNVITEEISLNKVQRVVEGHPVFFDALKHFAEKGNQITYIIGNHDQDVLWPSVKRYLNDTLNTIIHYKNIVYFFDGVHIEHGHMHEAANRLNAKKFFLKKNWPEAILNLPLGSHFFIDYVLKIKNTYPHVDKVRPFSRMLRWGLFNETKVFIYAFFQFIFYFVYSLLRKDNLRIWSFKNFMEIVLESAVFPDLSLGARKILEDERVKMVIFGHTHVYEYKQWDDDKEYFNTGTWTDLTSLDIASLGKITKLTYVLLEYEEEREAPLGRLKEWIGYHKEEENIFIS